METLSVTLKVITPLFLGGADPNAQAELREPSIKGALRFWYRAVDPDYRAIDSSGRQNEARIFGGTGKQEGQSTFLLSVSTTERTGRHQWNLRDYDDSIFNSRHGGYETRPPHSSSNRRTWTLNGVRYFSYPLTMPPNDRRYIKPETIITVTLIFRHLPTSIDRQRILASVWLLGHVGGLGTRSRRAFGTVALQSWATSNAAGWPELSRLPIAHTATSVAEWCTIFDSALRTLRIWFGTTHTSDHSVFGTHTRFKLFNSGSISWKLAFNNAAVTMQRFRQRHDLAVASSDYFRVKRHIVNKVPQTAGSVGAAVGSAALTQTPDRAAFGLPLTFQYTSLIYTYTDKNGNTKTSRPPGTTFQGQQHDRSASRIHVRIVQIGTNYHPLYIRLDAPLLEDREQTKDGWGNNCRVPSGIDAILDQFWNTLTAALAQEVRW